MFRIIVILCSVGFVLFSCVDPVRRPITRNFNRASCNSNVDSVTIDELPNVTNRNISEYRLSGFCDRDRSEVLVNIESVPISRHPICHQGKWETAVDISGIVNKKERFQVAVSQGSSTNNLLCQQVRNFFICPENYIAVSEIPYVESEAFCVMKYEAKVKRGDRIPNQLGQNEIVPALALADGDLITRVNLEDAIQFCNKNGPGYTLINNEEWQAIAKHIERTPYNWSNNTTDIRAGNQLNIGTRGSPRSNSNTDEERSGWSKYKRVHQLANQEHIWDFAGNLWEIVQHDIRRLPIEYNGFIHQIPQELQDIFGPQKDYSTLNNRERVNFFGGLGFVQANRFEGTLLRGGAQFNNRGIFSVDVTRTANRVRRTDVGFRCVFHP